MPCVKTSEVPPDRFESLARLPSPDRPQNAREVERLRPSVRVPPTTTAPALAIALLFFIPGVLLVSQVSEKEVSLSGRAVSLHDAGPLDALRGCPGDEGGWKENAELRESREVQLEEKRRENARAAEQVEVVVKLRRVLGEK